MVRPLALALALVLSAASARAQSVVLVKAETLTLRAKPDPKADKVQTLHTFEPVTLKKREGEWAQVDSNDGKPGWVLAEFLTPTRFATVGADKAEAKIGPGKDYEVILKYPKTQPLKVLDWSEGGWVRVADAEGDQSWTLDKNLSFKPFIVTTKSASNVRKGPGQDRDVAFTTDKGVIFPVLEEKNGWLRVKAADGDEGWIMAKIVFGWLDPTEPEKKPLPPELAKPPQKTSDDDAKTSAPAKKSPPADAKKPPAKKSKK